MPARRKTGNSSDSSKPDDEAYRQKRQRNNDAVKKTRAKSKETANERKRNVEKLRKENQDLETQIEETKRHVKTLKDLLLTNISQDKHDEVLNKILNEQTDDEDMDDGTTT